jgi:hypothetical protein
MGAILAGDLGSMSYALQCSKPPRGPYECRAKLLQRRSWLIFAAGASRRAVRAPAGSLPASPETSRSRLWRHAGLRRESAREYYPCAGAPRSLLATLREWALYPIYVRGGAYLAAHQGIEAATEFQKFSITAGSLPAIPSASDEISIRPRDHQRAFG